MLGGAATVAQSFRLFDALGEFALADAGATLHHRFRCLCLSVASPSAHFTYGSANGCLPLSSFELDTDTSPNPTLPPANLPPLFPRCATLLLDAAHIRIETTLSPPPPPACTSL